MRARLRSLMRGLLRRPKIESAMDTEMRFHMAAYADDLVRSGVPREEAERRVRMEFGSLEALKEDCRQARGLRYFDELRQDLRYTLRTLARSPGVAAIAVLSLALGIGASTAIFSLVDAVLLRFVPVRDPQQLYFMAHGTGRVPSTSSNYPLYESYRELDVLAGVTASDRTEFKVRNGEEMEVVGGQYVSGNYHGLLGVGMALGRGFVAEPDRSAGASPFAVISDAYWSRRFGRDPAVIGKTLVLEDRTVSIAGVTQPEFYGLYPGTRIDITLPLSMRSVIDSPAFLNAVNRWSSLTLVGRLRPGVGEARAHTAADAVFQQFMARPECKWARDLWPNDFNVAALLPAGKGVAGLRQRYSQPLYALMGMVGILLLVACANIANLLLARATARKKEMAVRLSLGAGRLRILRQLLTESLALSLLGGSLGMLLAVWIPPLLVSLLAVGRYPVVLDVSPNLRVLGFTFAVCVFTGILFGLAPAIRATRVDLTPALKDSATFDSKARRLLGGRLLVAAQMALSILLLAGAGLLVRTFHNLRLADVGFERDNVLLINLDTRAAKIPAARLSGFYEDLLGRVHELPGVRGASYSTQSPLGTGYNIRAIQLPESPDDARARGVWANVISPGYFGTLGIRLLRGRDFNAQDRAGRSNVVIVNEAMARFYYGESNVIGRRLAFRSKPAELFEIVGVAADTSQQNLRDAPARIVYSPWAQATEPPGSMTVVVRSSGDPRPLAASVRAEVRRLSKDVVLDYVRTMTDQIGATLVQERLLASLSSVFGVVTLLLACVGLYGVMGYAVVRRTREIGIRMALGAERRAVLRHFLGDSLRLALMGIVIGLPMAIVAARRVTNLLYGLPPDDPWTLAGAAVVLVAVALLAGYFPAQRAARIDPIRALRHE